MSNKPYRTLVPLFDALQGERVIVRSYHEDDAQALFEAINESREHIRPWLPFANAHQTIEETQDWIIHQKAQFLLREDFNCGIWETATQRFLGGIGMHIHNWKIAYFKIGYWLRVSAPGNGYMTEAVRLLTEFAFSSLNANRVEIRCDERNIRSASVAQRLGFTQEGCLHNDPKATDGSLSNTLIFARIAESSAL